MSAKARGVPKGTVSVMARRLDVPNSLDFFPTPPWATRALCQHILSGPDYQGRTVWEPAAGAGHMSDVLGEYFSTVLSSDVHDYGRFDAIGSFVGEGADVFPNQECDWVITNPPFNLAQPFVERGLAVARRGVAVLVRTAWLEGGGRYRDLFSVHAPHTVAIFAERVPMVKGRWDPEASSATSYAWIVWRRGPWCAPTRLAWIPPGCRAALTKPDDVARFAAVAEAAE